MPLAPFLDRSKPRLGHFGRRNREVEAIGGRVHLRRRAETGSGCGLRGQGVDLGIESGHMWLSR